MPLPIHNPTRAVAVAVSAAIQMPRQKTSGWPAFVFQKS
jgi:hypothetical protein